ncbi:MAG: hypothetical protein AAGI01_09225 [Myxococcota bacterium]
MEDETQTQSTPADEARQERGAVVILGIALLTIALAGFPCCMYFSIGIVQGIFQLNTGQYTNPARTDRNSKERDVKYDPDYSKTRRAPGPEERGEDAQ